jgi:hypothetical protein
MGASCVDHPFSASLDGHTTNHEHALLFGSDRGEDDSCQISNCDRKGRAIVMVLVWGLLFSMLIPFAVLLAPFFIWIAPTVAGAAAIIVIEAVLRPRFLRLHQS